MGNIIQFQPPGRKPGQHTDTAGSRAGSLIIFPGVRVERHDIDLSSRVREAVSEAVTTEIDGGRPRRTS
jgi:hypothetical protein